MLFLDKLNTNGLYKCGSLDLEFSGTIPYVISTIVTIIKIVVPVLLIIFGMIDFLKSVTASKEDEIKKGQQTFIKRLIAAIIVFFVIQIVQLVVKFASGNDESIVKCFDCFVNGNSSEVNSCKPVKSVNNKGA